MVRIYGLRTNAREGVLRHSVRYDNRTKPRKVRLGLA